jgi:hypothetical protein
MDTVHKGRRNRETDAGRVALDAYQRSHLVVVGIRPDGGDRVAEPSPFNLNPPS